jgi:hypothetical protein
MAEKGVALSAKPFALGFRIEHPQAWLDAAQYGAEDAQGVSAGALSVHLHAVWLRIQLVFAVGVDLPTCSSTASSPSRRSCAARASCQWPTTPSR